MGNDPERGFDGYILNIVVGLQPGEPFEVVAEMGLVKEIQFVGNRSQLVSSRSADRMQYGLKPMQR